MTDSLVQTAMDKLENGAMCIAAGLLLLVAVAIPIDVVGFYREKETYAWVHQLDTNQPNWEWQYVQRLVYLGVLVLIGLGVMVLRWINRNNRIIRIANLSFLVLFFGSLIFGFYNWMNTGFDH